MGMCCEKKTLIGWRNVWNIRWWAPDQEVDQWEHGKRLCKKIAKHILNCGKFIFNFTILVYSPTKITSLFYPVWKFSYFCICDNPLNCYYFTQQSYPFAHLTSFRRSTKFTTVYGSSVIQLPSASSLPSALCSRINIRFGIYIGTDWVRLIFFL